MADTENKLTLALRILRKFIEGKAVTDDEIFDAFPGLRESEDERIRDERIRKEIIGFIEWSIERGSITTEQMIASQSWFAYLERQKEQKPEDNPKWNELTWKDINTIERIINNVHYEFRNGIGEESFGKEVLERFRDEKDDAEVDACEQKPAWSEEDEKNLELVIDYIYEFYPDPVMKYKLKDWLKSLRPSWRPGAEQISMVTRVCNNLHMQNSPDAEGMDELLKQLEKIYWNTPSIEEKNSWKPSEEQLEILDDFLFHIPATNPYKLRLISLRDGLLKLK